MDACPNINVESPLRDQKDRSTGKASTPSSALIFLLAATAGLVVMNIYYNQPILNAIAGTLKVGPSRHRLGINRHPARLRGGHAVCPTHRRQRRP